MQKIKAILDIIGDYNPDKLSTITDTQHLESELDTISRMKRGIEYYRHIIQKVEIDRGNEKNSYIMWLFDKVDKIDTDSPCKIVKRNISLPDIDTDFPVEKRGDVIRYLKDTYGEANVCQIATFGRLMGRGALKEVLRVHNACNQDVMNTITKNIPDEASINDELEVMEKETGTSSIIRWTLENEPEKLSEWAKIEHDGSISGPFAEYFKQAIRLEGCIKSVGKHASGIIVSDEPLADIVPIEYDRKTGEVYAGMENLDLEFLGLVKLDILGVSTLDKLEDAAKLLRTGKL